MSKDADSEKDIKITELEPEGDTESGADPSSPEAGLQPELPPDPQSRLSGLEEELTSQKDKYLRLVAEFDNFKKRNVRDRIELLKYASEEMITALLPVLDDLERARAAGQLSEGLELIYQKLVGTLEQKGLQPMKAKGKEFNPDLHDALSQVPAEKKSDKDKVVDEIEKGYFLNDKVIRHAKVVVGS